MVFTIEMLRTLKGAPLAVLIALALTRQPAGAEYLARVTGYSYKPTQQALELLADYGLVSHNGRYTWQIAGETVQLPFTLPEGTQDTQIRKIKTWKNSNSQSTAATANRRESSLRSAEAVFTEKELEKFHLNIKTLREFKIYEPKARELAALTWVDPDYIRRHCEKGERNGDSLGLVIFRMQHSDPAPLTETEEQLAAWGISPNTRNGGDEEDEE